jgi:eukaryotic-like serine/threonine-protein kinase
MNELDLFAAAIAIPDPTQRAALLEQECAGHSELRLRLDQLLDAHFRSHAAMDPTGLEQMRRAVAPGASPAESTANYPGKDECVGAVLDKKYKLIEEIGEGGMGSVYMAQQTEPVKRAVAVKVIKAGMDSKAILARFEAERQALALMDHPNIARVLDAGATASGRPFFVMELVRGTPITKFCDDRKLTPRQRLELFVPVCQAIQHAHQKGVIHRDIKPSNVLIALYDDRPVPKVIDFGVAKASGLTLTDKTLMTGFGSVIGTPEYMSPEQASLNNLDVDTRSDVYSLGVLLYELLTGSTPVDRKSLGKAALFEILRIVREVEAQRPSAKLSTLDTLPSVAANRGTEKTKLSRLMKGELDWVVMKSLEKDRTRRYESANGLACDIQRYLADEVVEARPPSAGYRIQKFARRHKGQVLAASLVLFALVAGVIGTSLGLLEARRQAAIADDEKNNALAAATAERQANLAAETRRQEAERNLAFAKKGNELLGSVFAGLDPKKIAESGRPLQDVLRENLAKAAKELDGSAIGDPLEVAGMQNTLGWSLHTLGDFGPAIAVSEKAWQTRKSRLGPDNPDTLQSLNRLALSYESAGIPVKAMQLLEEALRLRKARLGPDHRDTLESMNNLGNCYRNAWKLDLALPLLEETLAREKANLGRDDPNTLATMSNLALCYSTDGRSDRSLPLLVETLKLRKARLGSDHPDTLVSMADLAWDYQDAGQLDRAEPLFVEALELQKAKLGPDHPDTLQSMAGLARHYMAAKKLDQARSLLEDLLKLSKAKLGLDHPHTLLSMNDLAIVYWGVGKRDRALSLLDEALPLLKARLGPNHRDTHIVMTNLAQTYQNIGKFDLALPLFEETLHLRSVKLGPDHPDTLTSMNNLALGYRAAGKPNKALVLFEEALRLRKARLGPVHHDTLQSMNNLALGYQAVGRPELALPLLEETFKLTKAKLGPDHRGTLATMHNLGVAYRDAGKLDLALPLLVEVVELKKTSLGPDHHDTLASMDNLAVGYQLSGKLDLALPLFQETFRLAKTKLGPNDPGTLTVMGNLASGYRADGKLDLALPLMIEAFELKKAKLGPDHADTLVAMNSLGVVYWSLKRFDKSVPLFEELVRIREKKFGRRHPDTMGAVANLGVNFKDSGRIQEAIPLLEEAYRSGGDPKLRVFFGRQLLDGYRKSDMTGQAVKLILEMVADARTRVPNDSPQLAGEMAISCELLLEVRAFTEPESLLRECLAIRQSKEPDDWRTFNTQSMLGGALLGQKKFAEAEPLLLAGYEGMKQRENSIPNAPQTAKRIPNALERLIELYTATGKPDEVRKWKAKRVKLSEVETKPAGKK